MTDTIEITAAHRALAAYLREREQDFGRSSDLAYEVLQRHKDAFGELIGRTDFSDFGACWNPDWTQAYRRVLELVPPPFESVPESGEDRTAQARALAAMRRREAELQAQLDALTAQRDAAQANLSRLYSRVGDIADKLLEQAEEREWCSEYDAFVTDNGFEDLLHVRAKAGHVHVTVTLSIDVDDISDYDISDEDVKNAIAYGGVDFEIETGEVCED